MTSETLSAEQAWNSIDQDWLSDEMKRLICKTIALLPADVQEFATCNCTFIDFDGKNFGSAWPASLFTHLNRRGRTMRNHWLITFGSALARNRNKGQFTVAHEIAHAWLGHAIMSDNLLQEKQADDMVKSWGFQIPKYRYKAHAVCRRIMERNAAAGVATADAKKTAKKSKKGGAK